MFNICTRGLISLGDFRCDLLFFPLCLSLSLKAIKLPSPVYVTQVNKNLKTVLLPTIFNVLQLLRFLRILFHTNALFTPPPFQALIPPHSRQCYLPLSLPGSATSLPFQAVPPPLLFQTVPPPLPFQAVPSPLPFQAVPPPFPFQAVPPPVPFQAVLPQPCRSRQWSVPCARVQRPSSLPALRNTPESIFLHFIQQLPQISSSMQMV